MVWHYWRNIHVRFVIIKSCVLHRFWLHIYNLLNFRGLLRYSYSVLLWHTSFGSRWCDLGRVVNFWWLLFFIFILRGRQIWRRVYHFLLRIRSYRLFLVKLSSFQLWFGQYSRLDFLLWLSVLIGLNPWAIIVSNGIAREFHCVQSVLIGYCWVIID